MAVFLLVLTGSPGIPVDIYLIQKRPHYPTAQKFSIARTPNSRADNIINKPEHKLAEFDHINQALQNNGFRMQMCSSDQFLAQPTESHPRSQPPDTFVFISVPYVQGFSEAIKRFWPKSALEWLYNHILCCHLQG